MTDHILYYVMYGVNFMGLYYVCNVKYLNGLERTYHSMTNLDYNDFLSNVFSSFLADDFELPVDSIDFRTFKCVETSYV